MAREIGKLSALAVRNAITPGYLSDGGGLYLQSSQFGTKSWVFRYTLAKRAREMGLGSLNAFTLKEARERARLCRQMLADGIDPIDQRDAEATARVAAVAERAAAEAKRVTFGQCAERCIDAKRAGWKNAKHASQWTNTLQTYCTSIWALPVNEITIDLVAGCLEPIWEIKTETATRLRGRMQSVLAWATVRRLRAGDNPAAWRNNLKELLAAPGKVRKVKPRPALPYTEVADFVAAVRMRQGFAPRAMELQLLTATRPGEAIGAQWDEFDIAGAVWVIPGGRMKAGIEHRVPLSPAVLALLASVPRVSPNVFPGVKGKPITTAAGEKLLKTMHAQSVASGGTGYMDPKEKMPIVAHGFRSTFRDYAGEMSEHPRETIEHALAHRLKDKAEAAYNRGDQLRRRALLMLEWSDYCEGKL